MWRSLRYAVMLGALMAPVTASAEDARDLVVGEVTRPFGSWFKFCEDYRPVCDTTPVPRIVMILTQHSLKVLEDVNREVNTRITFKTDIEHWGWDDRRYVYETKNGLDVDKWSYGEDGFGDCEDYALLKQKTLLEKGWPRSALLITVVDSPLRDVNGNIQKDTSGNVKKTGHAVLTVRTNKGDLILDDGSQTNFIKRWWQTDYLFRFRQSETDPNVWVLLKRPAFVEVK